MRGLVLVNEVYDDIMCLEEQFSKLLNELGELSNDTLCPHSLGLKNSAECIMSNCRDCWENMPNEIHVKIGVLFDD